MSGPAFVDTNIFVYAADRRDPAKRRRAREVLAAAMAEEAVVSYQVVQETINVLTSKFRATANAFDARELLHGVLEPLWRVHPSWPLYERALALRDRYGFQFYDSLIVAGALEAGCTRLLSEDFQHGQVIEGLVIEDPFRG